MMTLEVCYAEMGADYAEVLERLRDERLIRRYVLRFLDDPSYDALCRAVSGGDWRRHSLRRIRLRGHAEPGLRRAVCIRFSADRGVAERSADGGGAPAAIGNSGLPPNRGLYSPASGWRRC